MRKLLALLDPLSGLSPDAEDGSLAAGVGGLPAGINPIAIGHLLKQQGIQVLDDVAPAVGRAAKDALSGARPVIRNWPSERRFAELLLKWNGRGNPNAKRLIDEHLSK
jgi:hypothetical protein